MSKSLEFCRICASDKAISTYYDRDWEKSFEIGSEEIFDEYTHGKRIIDVNGSKLFLKFDPDADFQYFTSSSCLHDGTFAFILSAIEECVIKVANLQTYYKPNGIPPDGSNVFCTVGNFVILNEYANRKRLHSRTTVLLPLSMKYEA